MTVLGFRISDNLVCLPVFTTLRNYYHCDGTNLNALDRFLALLTV